ncbi:flavin reductase family protein [soil metagenome]
MFDATTLRSAFGCFATGAAIVTMADDDCTYRGMTINSLASLSLDPPLLLWSIARSSRNHDAFTTAPQFAIHVLKSSQEDLARRFGSKDGDRFEGVYVDHGIGGVPLLRESLMRFQCSGECCFPGGDHTIIVGRIVDITESVGDPLVLFRSRPARLQSAATV